MLKTTPEKVAALTGLMLHIWNELTVDRYRSLSEISRQLADHGHRAGVANIEACCFQLVERGMASAKDAHSRGNASFMRAALPERHPVRRDPAPAPAASLARAPEAGEDPLDNLDAALAAAALTIEKARDAILTLRVNQCDPGELQDLRARAEDLAVIQGALKRINA